MLLLAVPLQRLAMTRFAPECTKNSLYAFP